MTNTLEILIVGVILLSTVTIIILKVIAVRALERHIQLRDKLLKEYDELTEWLDAYELCINWHLLHYPPELNSSYLRIKSNDPLINDKLRLMIESYIIPWVKESRLYMEGYYHTSNARNKIFEILYS